MRQALLELYEWQDRERTQFEQTGSTVEHLRNWEFKITQPRFAEKVLPISVDRGARNDPSRATSQQEKTGLRGLLAAVPWRASQSAPWLSVALSYLLSEVPRSTVQTLVEANKLLRSMRRTSAMGLHVFAYPK